MNTGLLVTLTGSDNEYLKYPVNGRISILEEGTGGQVIVAVFRVNHEGRASAPVEVRRPKFKYPAE